MPKKKPKKKSSANKAYKKKKVTTRETLLLTSEYHHARRQLVLWSAILFAWEFIGIDLKAMQGAEGTLGTLAKSLKSPQAVPWVLLILVIYFFYRVIIEFVQYHHTALEEHAPKVDIIVTMTIAVIAILLFFTHKLLNVQVAEGKSLIGNIISTVIFLLIFLFFSLISSFISEFRKLKKGEYFPYFIIFFIIISIPLLYIIFWVAFNIKAVAPDARVSHPLLILILFAILMIAFHFLNRFRSNFKKEKKKIKR